MGTRLPLKRQSLVGENRHIRDIVLVAIASSTIDGRRVQTRRGVKLRSGVLIDKTTDLCAGLAGLAGLTSLARQCSGSNGPRPSRFTSARPQHPPTSTTSTGRPHGTEYGLMLGHIITPRRRFFFFTTNTQGVHSGTDANGTPELILSGRSPGLAAPSLEPTQSFRWCRATDG
jgi:hypothetical protein